MQNAWGSDNKSLLLAPENPRLLEMFGLEGILNIM